MTDWADDPAIRDWIYDAQQNLRPHVEGSTVGVSILPTGEPDAKIAVELGFMILMNKPIIGIRKPGTPLSPKVAAVLDIDLQADLTTTEGRETVRAFFRSEEFNEIVKRAEGELDD